MSEADRPRHPALVRITHWLTALAFLALFVTGAGIVISHPRFYWGESGNVNMPPLFSIPIPSSRSMVPTGYGYTLPDQNGWSRYLHFEAAWLVALAGAIYLAFGFLAGHFWRHLIPSRNALEPKRLMQEISNHLRFAPAPDDLSYNSLQRVTYLLVVFVLFPLIIWTGLAMSPAFESVWPSAVSTLGGRQSARTVHFFVAVFLTLFVVVHVLMVFLAGFRHRVGAMITGRAGRAVERV